MTMTEEKLELKHASSIGQKLKLIPTALSEYCFPNLYLFREKHEYRVLSFGNNHYISGLSYNKERYIMPLEDLENSTEEYSKMLIDLLEEYDCIFPIPEKWLRLFPESDFKREFLDDDSEYIYNREKLAEYPGRKLSKKRNLVNQFLANNEPEIRPVNNCNKPHIIELLELWQSRSEQEMGSSDYLSCIDALNHFETLQLSGALFLTDGEPCGFIMGEASGESSYIIHFAKGDTEKKGIYQYMFQAYVREFCKDARIINLEQDMGMEGLRKTKRSYQPDLMLHKYRIYKA
ncbi:MAG: DUF2156 domain-containing protein [Spirochaetaceae bacterium]|nr:DUF2156 domain-containing protein [Spirochaetaceae bacterium]